MSSEASSKPGGDMHMSPPTKTPLFRAQPRSEAQGRRAGSIPVAPTTCEPCPKGRGSLQFHSPRSDRVRGGGFVSSEASAKPGGDMHMSPPTKTPLFRAQPRSEAQGRRAGSIPVAPTTCEPCPKGRGSLQFHSPRSDRVRGGGFVSSEASAKPGGEPRTWLPPDEDAALPRTAPERSAGAARWFDSSRPDHLRALSERTGLAPIRRTCDRVGGMVRAGRRGRRGGCRAPFQHAAATRRRSSTTSDQPTGRRSRSSTDCLLGPWRSSRDRRNPHP